MLAPSTPGHPGARDRMTPGGSHEAVIEAARTRVLELLRNRLTDPRHPVDDLSSRLDRARAATSLEELRALVSDLPGGRSIVPVPPAPHRLSTGARGGAASGEEPPAAAGKPPSAVSAASPMPPLEARATAAEVRDQDFLFVHQDGAVRSGPWIPARHTWVLNVMGGADLDFREARFGPGVTEVSVFSVFGGVEIVVPPDLQVECEGTAVLAAFEADPGLRPVTDPTAPVLRVNGVSILAGVAVTPRARSPGAGSGPGSGGRGTASGDLPPGPDRGKGSTSGSGG